MMTFKIVKLDDDYEHVKDLKRILFNRNNKHFLKFLHSAMGFKKVKKDAYERLKRDICRIVLEYLKRCREKGESLTEKKLPYVKIQIEEFGETEIELF